MRKLIAAAASTALCLVSISPAFAQSSNYSSIGGPAGAGATVNFRVPFAGKAAKSEPTFGFRLTYGHEMGTPTLDGKTTSRAATFADLRFNTKGSLSQAKVVSFDLANLEKDRRMDMAGDNVWLWVALAAGAGVALYFILDDDDDDEDEDDD